MNAIADLDPHACERCGKAHPRCSRHRKHRDDDGNLVPCGNHPLRGLDVCRMHVGKSRDAARAEGQANLEQQAATAAVRTLGLPVDVDPHEALLQEVHRTAGHVAWLAEVVADLERESVTRGVSKTVMHPDGGRQVEVTAGVNVWVKLYQDERDHLRRVCADSIRAGIDERRVRIVEEQAEQLVAVMRAALAALVDRVAEVSGDASLVRDLTAFLPTAIRGAIESSGVIDGQAVES